MAIVIYGTEGESNTYHADRGNVEWAAATTPQRLVSLARASEWIDGKYRRSFPGWKTGLRTQEREWPRQAAFDRDRNEIPSTEIPVEVRNATYEAALRDLKSANSLLTDVTMGKNVISAAVSGAVSVTYAGATDPMDLQLTIPAVDRILAPVLTGSGSATGLSAPSIRG